MMEARRGDQRSGREMIHGKRMILKGRMEIGHGGMPCIARLGKEAKIGKPEAFNHLRIGREHSYGADLTHPRMQQKSRR